MRQGFSLVEVMAALVLFGALLLVLSWTAKLTVGGGKGSRLKAGAVAVAQRELESIRAMNFNAVTAEPPAPVSQRYTVERIVRGMALDSQGALTPESLPRAKLKYVEVVVRWRGGEVRMPTLLSGRLKEGA